MKSYKVCGRNFYPGILKFQLGLHVIAVPLLMWIVSIFIRREGNWALLLGSSVILLIEIAFCLLCFDDELAKDINKDGYPPIDFNWDY